MSSTNKFPTVLITSCDGATGSSIANHLAKCDDRIHEVRMLCQNKDEAHAHLLSGSRNFKLCQVNPTDKDAIKQLMQGVDLVAIVPPARHNKFDVARTMLSCTIDAQVPNAILLSWCGTHAGESTAKTTQLAKFKDLEQAFMAADGIHNKVTVRANWFADNLTTYATLIVHNKSLPLPVGTSAKIAPLDSDVLGMALAKLMGMMLGDEKVTGGDSKMVDKVKNQTLTFTGATPMSGPDMARELGKAMGCEIAFKDVTLDQAKQVLCQTRPKLDESEIDALLETYTLWKDGIMDRTSDDLMQVLGIEHPKFDVSATRLKPLLFSFAGAQGETGGMAGQQKVMAQTEGVKTK
ncbi:hypothetical protein BCR44DRAFT_128894 [Catenaria anguillulae PL171]|uniref:NAD(P)-binding domain-containing protein n=1 Tax=Catenaria anguillulae PL171 TaxID=765915 RepID=A0A1Y2HX31_9FUNG|nr:hypothetical protein BCR44DRAFT_128894 [Catenaria anguillulae PL171]